MSAAENPAGEPTGGLDPFELFDVFGLFDADERAQGACK